MSLMKGTSRRKKDTPVFFVARFSQPMTGFGGWRDGKLLEASDAIQGENVGSYVRFEADADTPILMKVGISYTSVEGARKNLDSELPDWDFDQIVRESKEDWNAPPLSNHRRRRKRRPEDQVLYGSLAFFAGASDRQRRRWRHIVT